MTVEFEFSVGQQAAIPGGTVGQIRGAWIDFDRLHQYLVGYTDKLGVFHEQWFRDSDLTTIKKRATRKKK